ncbi:hypothetical protein GIB67_002703, partial [Kingdonia uniflora]
MFLGRIVEVRKLSKSFERMFILSGILAQESISFERAWMSFERDIMFLGLKTNYRKVVQTSLESFKPAWHRFALDVR